MGVPKVRGGVAVVVWSMQACAAAALSLPLPPLTPPSLPFPHGGRWPRTAGRPAAVLHSELTLDFLLPPIKTTPVQAVAEDRWPFKTAIPPLLQYPVSDRAFDFVQSLVWMFYAPAWAGGWGYGWRRMGHVRRQEGVIWVRRWDGCRKETGKTPVTCSECSSSPAGHLCAGNVKGLFGLLACFLPGGSSKAATNGKKTQ